MNVDNNNVGFFQSGNLSTAGNDVGMFQVHKHLAVWLSWPRWGYFFDRTYMWIINTLHSSLWGPISPLVCTYLQSFFLKELNSIHHPMLMLQIWSRVCTRTKRTWITTSSASFTTQSGLDKGRLPLRSKASVSILVLVIVVATMRIFFWPNIYVDNQYFA